MKCQICASTDARPFLDLEKHPPCDFLTKAGIKKEKKYPLRVHFCTACGLVQLQKPVPQEILFKGNYHHIAALSSSFREHLDALAERTVKRFKLTRKDLVVELGSNDGALLESFKKRGVKVLGVDPSDVTKIAIKKGIETVTAYFDEALGKTIAKKYGKARVIAALNTFAHVSHLHSVVAGIRELLSDDGVFISENHYVLELVKRLQYDFIYHEHSRYYSLRSLVALFKKDDMEVFDVERIPTHSGSIRVYAAKAGAYPISKRLENALKGEKDFGLDRWSTYTAFAKKVADHRKRFGNMLRDLHAEGHSIAGLTFPARAVTLLGSCGIGSETIDYITEMSAIKIGRFAPGSHIKVVDQKILFGDDQPDYGVLLSWHIAKEIIPRFRAKGFRGKIIIPLPAPRVVS